jgi:NAD(P)-dependent dehydrogenase (short-subunit alcohol dehydrogenase family)
MSHRLEGKVAIVFGAGSAGPGWGIGKATAVQFSREGAIVVAVDSNLIAAKETQAIIASESGPECSTYQADVTASEKVRDVVRAVIDKHGRIDVLFNNVGVTKMGGPIELSEEDWDLVHDVNLKSVFLTCKHVLPHMISRKKGVVISNSSIAAIRYLGFPYSAYYSSKAAINQFTRSVALQYARHGIRANAILPGLMDTPFVQQQIRRRDEDHDEMIRARNEAGPIGRMGTSWDVAKAAVFLASDEAEYITGVCLPVDGGITPRCF